MTPEAAAPPAAPPPLQRSLHLPYRWGDAPTEAHLLAMEIERRKARHKLITEIEDPEHRAKVMEAERELCRRDVVHWAEQWGWIADPHAAFTQHPWMVDVPVMLWPEQARLLRWLDERIRAGEPSLVAKGRKLGVTWCHLLLCVHHLTLTQGWTARLASAKEDKVDDGTPDSLFGMARYILRNLPAWLNPCRPNEDRDLWLGCAATRGDVVGESANTGLARGGRRAWLMLDEFAHIDPPAKAVQIWTSTATVARSRALLSTHKGPGTRFAKLEVLFPPHQVFRMTWRADPRRPIDTFKAEEMLREGMSEAEFQQEHEARAITLAEGLMFKGPVDPAQLERWQADPRTDKGEAPRLPIRAIEYWDEESDFAAIQAEEDILHRGFLCGGWDFGTSAASLLVCLRAVVEPGPRWRLWIDAEHRWAQTSWMTAAADVLSWDRHRYGNQERGHWGDPAGKARESDLKSWQDNLRAGGVPLTCLDPYYNTRDGQEWALREAQSLIDAGRLRVHRRCEYLWSCLEQWTRDIPHGASPDLINRLYIPPRHDVYSHGGMALVYLIAGVLIGISAAHDRRVDVLEALPPGPGGEIGRMLAAGG